MADRAEGPTPRARQEGGEAVRSGQELRTMRAFRGHGQGQGGSSSLHRNGDPRVESSGAGGIAAWPCGVAGVMYCSSGSALHG
jgi:hypothetical protein